MLQAVLQKNDKKAYWLIGIFSVVVFATVSALSNFKLGIHSNFDVHIFAKINAVINTAVALLLIAGLTAVKNGKYKLHRNIMITAMLLSILFLVSYIAHHLLAGDARFGDINHDGLLSDDEKLQSGGLRIFYLILLSTHILLAAVILPFILFTAYRALTSEWPLHKKLAKYTWPLWLYVAVTGPIVYFLISPYYT
jgi:putative membrane protein